MSVNGCHYVRLVQNPQWRTAKAIVALITARYDAGGWPSS